MEFRGMMGGFYRISEWIMRLSVTNVLWVICSLPFFFFVLTIFMQPELQSNPDFLKQWLFLIAIVAPFTLLPASGAMFTVVRKWVTGDADVPLFKTFFRGYKENYVQSMLGGIFFELLGVILYVNYYFYGKQSGTLQLLSVVFIIFMVLLVAALFNYLSIMVHFHMKFRHIVKNALLLTIGHPIISISLVVTNFVILYFSGQFTFLIPFFMGSLMAVCSFFLFYRSFERMKEKLQRREEAEAESEETELSEEEANKLGESGQHKQ